MKLKAHKDNGGLRHVARDGITVALKLDRSPGRKAITRKQGCRHHKWKVTDVPPSIHTNTDTTYTDATAYEYKRQYLDAWRHADTLNYNNKNECK